MDENKILNSEPLNNDITNEVEQISSIDDTSKIATQSDIDLGEKFIRTDIDTTIDNTVTTNNTTTYSYVGKPPEHVVNTVPNAQQHTIEPIIIEPSNIKQVKKEKKEKKPRKNTGLLVLVILCMIITPILSVVGGYLGVKLATPKAEVTTIPDKIEEKADIPTQETNFNNSNGFDLSELSVFVSPTVVEIEVEAVVNNFFSQQSIEVGAGSGVIISADGYIVTNNHVIEDATNVKVRLYNGDVYEAEYIGSDPQTDLAIVKIETDGLQFAKYGDSSSLKVGQDVIAVGNPLGQLGGTVTDGIISALDREIYIDGFTMTLLQTNAAVNPGNSGGGLFNNKGELIGIVNAKQIGDEIEGLGFAIPSNIAKQVTDDLINDGYVGGRVLVGISILEITNSEIGMQYGITDEKDFGVYIVGITENSSASHAGLKVGDRLLSINDKKMETTQDIKDIFEEVGVFNTVDVLVNRRGEEVKIELFLTEAVPENQKQ